MLLYLRETCSPVDDNLSLVWEGVGDVGLMSNEATTLIYIERKNEKLKITTERG